uniref:Uncharacterized protein n=1 Tax=Arundo donax TaxID=35708 RepID=A0A0A9GLT9_ARUDO
MMLQDQFNQNLFIITKQYLW